MECEYFESNREDIRATTIPSPEGMNLHAPVHMFKLVGAWPFLLVCLSSHARCTLDMVLGTWLRMAQAVVAILDQSRKALSFASVEVEYELETESFDYAPGQSLIRDQHWHQEVCSGNGNHELVFPIGSLTHLDPPCFQRKLYWRCACPC